MDAIIPEGCIPYKRTPVFDQDTVPPGLQRQHNLKAGVWGALHILEGKLLFRRFDPPGETIGDMSVSPIIIEPLRLHEVSLLGPVKFYVEFYMAPESKTGEDKEVP